MPPSRGRANSVNTAASPLHSDNASLQGSRASNLPWWHDRIRSAAAESSRGSVRSVSALSVGSSVRRPCSAPSTKEHTVVAAGSVEWTRSPVYDKSLTRRKAGLRAALAQRSVDRDREAVKKPMREFCEEWRAVKQPASAEHLTKSPPVLQSPSASRGMPSRLAARAYARLRLDTAMENVQVASDELAENEI
eukprot:gnl/MRDRNA2_/MRDRNA2_138184_c0_seq1.p1 gnl/MRDRNA2_/MRDRNA2_138184_c0~~gnl/MRDRNA2_/MRDRNA2_138184_c0_seq1.p1  ORF type:complete len:204 (+),score=34.97 gnl/MRDRNA2_/MRDRNA2_138184_c0_seq1:37-612(+)